MASLCYLGVSWTTLINNSKGYFWHCVYVVQPSATYMQSCTDIVCVFFSDFSSGFSDHPRIIYLCSLCLNLSSPSPPKSIPDFHPFPLIIRVLFDPLPWAPFPHQHYGSLYNTPSFPPITCPIYPFTLGNNCILLFLSQAPFFSFPLWFLSIFLAPVLTSGNIPKTRIWY